MLSFLVTSRLLYFSLLAALTNKTCRTPKVRREWRDLSLREQAEWIDAVNCLTALPHDPRLEPSVPANISLIPPVNEDSSHYDDFVYLHMDLNIKIHYTGLFLPWHRYYVQRFEDALTEKCDYKGAQPYWDWTQDAHDFYNSKFFDNSSSGVGGWGDPADDYQISTGGLKDAIVAYPNPHHIRRNFTLFPLTDPGDLPPFGDDPSAPPPQKDFMINTTMTKQNVDFTVDNFEGDFIGFQTYLESTPGTHVGAHFILGGDMYGSCPNGAPPDCVPGPTWTSNDPLFFMHHAMVDKIWYDWQKKSLRNKYSFGGGSVAALSSFAAFRQFPTGLPPYVNFDSEVPGDGLWDGIQVWDMIDTTGDTLCYVYA